MPVSYQLPIHYGHIIIVNVLFLSIGESPSQTRFNFLLSALLPKPLWNTKLKFDGRLLLEDLVNPLGRIHGGERRRLHRRCGIHGRILCGRDAGIPFGGEWSGLPEWFTRHWIDWTIFIENTVGVFLWWEIARLLRRCRWTLPSRGASSCLVSFVQDDCQWLELVPDPQVVVGRK